MNFLAHAYLSFGHPWLIVGNMISDFVKGSARYSYSEAVQKGIMLHRQIDAFTDAHPATHKAKEPFRPHYRLYSGPITDIVYDYFLANDDAIFTEASLKTFSQSIYGCLEAEASGLPANFLLMFSYMKTEDWLYNYRYKDRIQKSLRGMARRAAYMKEGETAYELFLQHHSYLRDCYRLFFKDVGEFAEQQVKTLL
jgi:acyl carrier protein phosphodiesterase